MYIHRRSVCIFVSSAVLAASISCGNAGSEFEPDELDVKAIAALIAKRSPMPLVLLVDVRHTQEFAVSRLEGAIQIEPDTPTEIVLRRLGTRIKGADIILYCTVGTRSMGLGINIQDELQKAGAKSVHIMKDGLIAWANADLPLVDHKGATRFVHPSDQSTRNRFLDPGRARFEPRI
jgi:rhodanese-related sulfurtransferase